MYEWKGVVFHSSLEDGKDSCSIKINGFHMMATTNQGSFSIDLREGKISLGGTSNNMIFIRDEKQNISFSTRDKSILKALKESGIPDILDGIADYKKNLWQWNSWLVISIVLIVSVILGSTVGFHFYGVNLAVKGISYDIDKKIGEAYISSMDFSYNEKTIFIQSTLQKIVDHLVSHLPQTNFKYHVDVMASEQVNAFALPGEKIVVLTGLLTSSHSWEEVAGVLAHEIMHAEKRHGVKKLVQQLGNSLILWCILGNTNGAVDEILDHVKVLTSLKFSRDMEREADIQGFYLLQRSGISPEGMIKFFESLQKYEHDTPEVWQSTHPLTSERISTLQTLLTNIKDFQQKDLGIEWEKVKEWAK